jgi:hypothetical protein
MRLIAQIVSWLALAATILPAVLYLEDQMQLAHAKIWMLVATVFWFVTTPFWMGRKSSEKPTASSLP